MVDQRARGVPGWSASCCCCTVTEMLVGSVSTVAAALQQARAGTVIKIKPGQYKEGRLLVKTPVQMIGDAPNISEVAVTGMIIFEVLLSVAAC